jgi:uncharacterized protein with PQ loop repeat
MTSLDLLGLVATGFTTSSFVPQVWRTWKTTKSSDMTSQNGGLDPDG